MKKEILSAVLAFVSICALAQGEQPTLAQLTDSGNLLVETSSGPVSLTASACQPLKGDKVTILDIQQNAMGVYGATVAHVRLMDGECAGQEGWLGMAHLAKSS